MDLAEHIRPGRGQQAAQLTLSLSMLVAQNDHAADRVVMVRESPRLTCPHARAVGQTRLFYL